MPGKKEQGMLNPINSPDWEYDGTKGHHDKPLLQSVFISSPIFGAKASEKITDEGQVHFFQAAVFGVQNQNADYVAVNDQEGIDMDYAGNIPSDSDVPADMKGLHPPYRVPNPGAADKATPHDPTSKRVAPANYKEDHESVSFGDGIGSALSIEVSSKKQGESSFAELMPSKGPGTAIGD